MKTTCPPVTKWNLFLALTALSCGAVEAALPAISAGETHSLFLRSDSVVLACGSGTYGQLGTGSTATRTTPSATIGPVQDISAGYYHSLYLKEDGTAWAAGLNTNGQLGDGTPANRSFPVQVLTDVQAVAAGHSHSLFLKNDGTAWATGSNSSGQLGSGPGTPSLRTPVQVMSGVKAIAAGYAHSFFLKTDDTLWACGRNSNGQLGDGSNTYQFAPVQVMTGVAAVSAGYLHSVILKTDQTAWACGFNVYGQLGDGTSGNNRLTPVQVMTGVTEVSAGGYHSLFLKSDDTVWAAGRNNYGQLGNGSSSPSTIPLHVFGNAKAISAGYQHSMFLENDGDVFATGQGGYYQLGTGSSSNRNVATAIISLQLPIILPTITTQPEAQTVLRGESAGFSVTAAGTTPLFYQWKHNGVLLIGATASTHVIASAQASDAGIYTCEVSNAGGTAGSDSALLRVNWAPTVADLPASQSVEAGASAILTATVDGSGPIAYQWKRNGEAIAGATSASVTISSASFNDEASYTCAVSNTVGADESTACVLAVTVDPTSGDMDGDGLSDSLEAYLVALGLDPTVPSIGARTRLEAVVPEIGEFYTAEQMQDLAVGKPVMEAQPDGSMLMEFFLEESAGIGSWTPVPLDLGDLAIEVGKVQVTIQPNDDATRFFRLGFQPAP